MAYRPDPAERGGQIRCATVVITLAAARIAQRTGAEGDLRDVVAELAEVFATAPTADPTAWRADLVAAGEIFGADEPRDPPTKLRR